MLDPATAGAMITGIVGVYKAYTEYKAALAKAHIEQQDVPIKSQDSAKGEQVAPIVKASVLQHGEPKDVQAIENFEDDPDTYQEALQKVLTRLAQRSPAFAKQIQMLAQQANIQSEGVTGTVNISGQGKVYGAAIGVSTGEVNLSDIKVRDDNEEQR